VASRLAQPCPAGATPRQASGSTAAYAATARQRIGATVLTIDEPSGRESTAHSLGPTWPRVFKPLNADAGSRLPGALGVRGLMRFRRSVCKSAR